MKSITATIFSSYGITVHILQGRTILDSAFSSPYASLICNRYITTSYHYDECPQRCPLDHFITFCTVTDLHTKESYLIGPYLRIQPDEAKCLEYMHTYHIKYTEKNCFYDFIRSLPVFSHQKDFLMLKNIYFLVNKKELHISDIKNYETELDKFKKVNSLTTSNFPNSILLDTDSNNLYDQERLSLSFVRTGDPEGLLTHFKNAPYIVYPFLAGSGNKNYYYTALTGIILASRAAVEGGMNYSQALQLCDMYLFQLEQLHEPDEFLTAVHTAYLDFASRTKDYQKLCSGHSPLIKDCLQQLMNYHFEDMSLASMADKLCVSASYLSRLFSQEVGISYNQYVTNLKIREACRLLENTNMSLSEISCSLCFSSQSYFQNVFKKYMKMTPNEYRKKLVLPLN